MKKIIAAVLLSTGVAAYAGDSTTDRSWTTGQKALAGVALAAHVMDWNQTRMISRNLCTVCDRSSPYASGGYYEKAPITRHIIGTHPSIGEVNTYMLGTAVLFMAMAHYLPEYRYAILGTWAVTRLAVVYQNKQIGLSVGFDF